MSNEQETEPDNVNEFSYDAEHEESKELKQPSFDTNDTTASTEQVEPSSSENIAYPASASAQRVAPVETIGKLNSPGLLVLQWLTYAFWGWTIVALLWLLSLTTTFFFKSGDTNDYMSSILAYSLAAVIVLFIVAFLCDVFYSRKEPSSKQGAATVIMIIHAVLFALFGIGALIVAVFAIISMVIGNVDVSRIGSSDGATATLTTASVIALVYGATLLRTLQPRWLKHSAKIYWAFMTVVTLATMIAAVFGPAVAANLTKDDRLIEGGLSSVALAVNRYAEQNDKLPENLKAISPELSDEKGKELVARNMVEYRPGGRVNSIRPLNLSELDSNSQSDFSRLSQDPAVFKYELCVVYKAEKDNGYDTYSSRELDTQPNTYSHDAGRVCYSLATRYVSSF